MVKEVLPTYGKVGNVILRRTMNGFMVAIE